MRKVNGVNGFQVLVHIVGKSIPILIRFQFNSIPDDLSSVELKISPIYNTSGWTSPSEFGDLILRHVKFPEHNPTKSDVGYTFEGEMTDVIDFAQRETQLYRILYILLKDNWIGTFVTFISTI